MFVVHILCKCSASESVKNELTNPEKFMKLTTPVDEKMKEVEAVINEKVCEKQENGEISEKDKELITGLNKNGNKKHAAEFRASIPYAYPLLKIHNLTKEQLADKVMPPNRLVHATKQGPLYRIEKWCSPYLTNISREYCGDEFILDTPDLLEEIDKLNDEVAICSKQPLLFTLDVIALYPSIVPELALEALADACSN